MKFIIPLVIVCGLLWGGKSYAWTGQCHMQFNIPSITVESGLSYSAGHLLSGWISGGKCEVGKAGTWTDMGINYTQLRYNSALPRFKDSDGKQYTIFETGSSGIGFIMSVFMESDRGNATMAVNSGNYNSVMGDAYSWANLVMSIRVVATGGIIPWTQVSWDIPVGHTMLQQGWPFYTADYISTRIYTPSFQIKQNTPGCVTSASNYAINMGVVPARRLPA
ncbi:hypothetical protein, partial [Aeromonas hydrophila]|uniref:hypothetical protein n=1 Tax=Aeromonas hydrophila TaxID=644 RepID=UPI001269B4D8